MPQKNFNELNEPIIGSTFDYSSDKAGTLLSNKTAVQRSLRGYLISDSHPLIKGKYQWGGNFDLFESGLVRDLSSTTKVWVTGGKNAYYIGAFAAGSPGLIPTQPEPDSRVNPAHSWGADAWAHARARLTKPDFSALQPLAEARELPKLFRMATMDVIRKVFHPSHRVKLRTLGELHLANQFGWAPLWSDIASYLKGARGAQKRANQLIRDEGKPVRRRGELLNKDVSTLTVTNDANSYMSPSLVSSVYRGTGRRTVKLRDIEHVWYSGRFRYWLPPGPGSPVEYREKLERALALNFQLTPSVVWNLVPWSWLIDWSTGLGTFFDAVSKGVEDRLTADYFYVMYHREFNNSATDAITVKTSGGTSPSYETVVSTCTRKWKRKTRARASPFGFGLRAQDLSAMQLSILGALGLSRL